MSNIDFESHLRDAEDENIAWLMTVGGLSLELACARAGVSVEAYEKRSLRAKKKADATVTYIAALMDPPTYDVVGEHLDATAGGP